MVVMIGRYRGVRVPTEAGFKIERRSMLYHLSSCGGLPRTLQSGRYLGPRPTDPAGHDHSTGGPAGAGCHIGFQFRWRDFPEAMRAPQYLRCSRTTFVTFATKNAAKPVVLKSPTDIGCTSSGFSREWLRLGPDLRSGDRYSHVSPIRPLHLTAVPKLCPWLCLGRWPLRFFSSYSFDLLV